MKILWVAPSFLHPTIGGGQIRTLGILRRLSERHEIHYVAFEDPAQPEGPARAAEYSFRAYPFPHSAACKRSVSFVAQLAARFSRTPADIRRYHSPELKRFLKDLLRQERFDRVVADFLVMSGCCPHQERSVLFQHNVETISWRRYFEHARDPQLRSYFRNQADRMFAYERAACRAAGCVIAVSAQDADLIRTMFGVEHVSDVPTGVDAQYFAPPASSPPVADLVFVGAMDWLANVDAVLYFLERILPQIRRRRPECTFAVVGRAPLPEIVRCAQQDTRVLVTGTVPDVRPYLWGASVSVVPLRIGSGTRIKICEAMAAGTPVVSTTIGAEGLELNPGQDICIADDPTDFAAQCLDLLENNERRSRMAAAARELVATRCSWEQVVRCFERVLETAPAAYS
jgi:polysaccharide biosynthesis protein PslH